MIYLTERHFVNLLGQSVNQEEMAEYNAHWRFKFDTGLFCQGITDKYGVILAATKLSQDVGSILQTEYGYLNYEISAAEEPLAWYAGESADYFETSPNSRVLKNHYNLVISVPDGAVSQAELSELAIGMVKNIEMNQAH